MKAFLLSAGLGTRLRPLTNDTPKCLLPVGGSTLLSIWLDLLARHGIDEVLVNSHHAAQKMQQFVSEYRGPVKITLTYEETLLGSAGTVRENWSFVKDEESFFICYSDNLTDADLTHLLEFHRKNRGVLTCALFQPPNPSACGIVETDSEGRIIHFEEKPSHPRSNLANAGIYVASPELIKYIPDRVPCDLGYDVLPKLVGKSFGVPVKGFLMDIGTHENYQLAQRLWPELASR